jgi:pullulanase/glycogen debranching enzyme
MGDECGRIQHGNNNAYCQDEDLELVRLVAHGEIPRALRGSGMIAFRRANPLRQPDFLTGGIALAAVIRISPGTAFSRDRLEPSRSIVGALRQTWGGGRRSAAFHILRDEYVLRAAGICASGQPKGMA